MMYQTTFTISCVLLLSVVTIPNLTAAFAPYNLLSTNKNNHAMVSTKPSLKVPLLSMTIARDGNDKGKESQESFIETKKSTSTIDNKYHQTRRKLLHKIMAGTTSTVAAAAIFIPSPAFAAVNTESMTLEKTPQAVEMKTFVDPKGLFSIRVPKGFFTLRRSAKGDLPDAKTGQGRRGSSIFTAGDMTKAEVVAVERFPAEVLLEEQGIDATGDLTTFSAMGSPLAIAELLYIRREKDRQGGLTNTKMLKDSVTLSEDGKTLSFQLRTQIDVQKPELLMEQQGVSELFRVTLARAELHSGDGQIMAVYASALEQDFRGVDGDALRDVITSFDVMTGSSKM